MVFMLFHAVSKGIPVFSLFICRFQFKTEQSQMNTYEDFCPLHELDFQKTLLRRFEEGREFLYYVFWGGGRKIFCSFLAGPELSLKKGG